jgi:hypothetical protein
MSCTSPRPVVPTVDRLVLTMKPSNIT